MIKKWFGTHEGLNKYDGYNVRSYQHNSSNPYSLSSNSISSICEDKSGMLWLGSSFNGLYKFDREKEEFANYKNEPGNPESLSCNTVCAIHEDKSGALWIGTQGAVGQPLQKSTNRVKKNKNILSQPIEIPPYFI